MFEKMVEEIEAASVVAENYNKKIGFEWWVASYRPGQGCLLVLDDKYIRQEMPSEYGHPAPWRSMFNELVEKVVVEWGVWIPSKKRGEDRVQAGLWILNYNDGDSAEPLLVEDEGRGPEALFRKLLSYYTTEALRHNSVETVVRALSSLWEGAEDKKAEIEAISIEDQLDCLCGGSLALGRRLTKVCPNGDTLWTAALNSWYRDNVVYH